VEITILLPLAARNDIVPLLTLQEGDNSAAHRIHAEFNSASQNSPYSRIINSQLIEFDSAKMLKTIRI
jgi:hypothetical protein